MLETIAKTMLAGQNMIYFAPERWDGLWRNRQQLMSIFAQHNKVLFVERRPYLRPTLLNFRRGGLKLSGLARSPVRRISKNLYVFRYPLWAPISNRFPLAQFTKTARRLLIRRALRQLKMSQPIVWLSRPHMVDLIAEVSSPRLLIYHVVDEYSAYTDHTPESRRRLEEQEKRLLAHADLVIVVSQKLYETKSPINPRTFVVPNGVNFEAFTHALADPQLPASLRAIRPPRLGYSGLIGDRLNLTMLLEVAKGHPEWSFVFLGEARVSQQAEIWRQLQALPNVFYLGSVAATEVPHYLKGFQVGLMPYVQSRETDNISPLKLYDYLAAGLPVASVDIPAAREFRSYIHIADTPTHFGHTLQSALLDTDHRCREIRRNVAAQHTWENRAGQISALIRSQLEVK